MSSKLYVNGISVTPWPWKLLSYNWMKWRCSYMETYNEYISDVAWGKIKEVLVEVYVGSIRKSVRFKFTKWVISTKSKRNTSFSIQPVSNAWTRTYGTLTCTPARLHDLGSRWPTCDEISLSEMLSLAPPRWRRAPVTVSQSKSSWNIMSDVVNHMRHKLCKHANAGEIK